MNPEEAARLEAELDDAIVQRNVMAELDRIRSTTPDLVAAAHAARMLWVLGEIFTGEDLGATEPLPPAITELLESGPPPWAWC